MIRHNLINWNAANHLAEKALLRPYDKSLIILRSTSVVDRRKEPSAKHKAVDMQVESTQNLKHCYMETKKTSAARKYLRHVIQQGQAENKHEWG